MPTKVKCCGISEDIGTITQIFVKKNENITEITEEAQNVLENLENVLLNNLDRKNITGDLGQWCCKRENNIAYFALVDFNYPDRLSYKLLKEINLIYEDFNEIHDLAEMKKNGYNLLEKYNKPEAFDKLSQAHQGVDEIKVDMKENIDKLITNQEDLSELEMQTGQMRDTANKFQKGAKSVERVMFWKKIKMIAYIVAIVIILVIIIVLIAKIF